MIHADWAVGPLTIHQDGKWPFTYNIQDKDGNILHSEEACAYSTKWKTPQDMLDVVGIPWKDQQEWIDAILFQRKKLMFLAQSEDIIYEY